MSFYNFLGEFQCKHAWVSRNYAWGFADFRDKVGKGNKTYDEIVVKTSIYFCEISDWNFEQALWSLTAALSSRDVELARIWLICAILSCLKLFEIGSAYLQNSTIQHRDSSSHFFGKQGEIYLANNAFFVKCRQEWRIARKMGWVNLRKLKCPQKVT